MHTTTVSHSAVSSGLHGFRCTGRLRVLLAGLLGLVLLSLGSRTVVAQVDFPGTPDDRGLNVRAYPTDVWGIRTGPGLGAGLVVHNLVREHDKVLVTAGPALYEQVGTATFASAHPRRAQRVVLVDGRALHTDRDWYGPSSRRTVLERSSVRARVRLGHAFWDRQLRLHPSIAIVHHAVNGVNTPASAESNGIVDDPTPLAQAGSQTTGLQPGLGVELDTRDRAVRTRTGLLIQGRWSRNVPLDDTEPTFDRYTVNASGSLALSGPHRVTAHLSSVVTRARGSSPVPLYLRPTVGGSTVPGWARGRFVNNDRLLGSVSYVLPVWSYLGLVVADVHLGLHVAGSYQNVGDQFTTAVSFEEPASDPRDYPLRPSASVGIQFVVPARDHTALTLGVGLSPEGLAGARFSLAHSLSTLRSPHHTTALVW